MKFTIFAIMAFLALGLTGCAHAFEEYGKQVGCIIAGNGCNSQGPAGAQGVAGANGTDGANGADGTNGTSCTVQAVAPGTVAPNGGAIITCGATSTLLVNGTNGTNGTNGQDGAPAPVTPYSISKVFTPCPGLSGTSREVLIVLQDKSVLASFSNDTTGNMTRLALIGQGSYVTTDGRGCTFTVDATKVSWTAGGAGSVTL